MGKIVRKVNGVLVNRGGVSKMGHYLIYGYLEFKSKDGSSEKVENVAMSPIMEAELALGVSYQFAAGSEINSIYKQNFLCSMQKFNGDVLVDDKILKYTTKTRYFLAYLSLIPPFTVIAPLVFRKARLMKEAQDEVNIFDPIEKSFIAKIKKRKF